MLRREGGGQRVALPPAPVVDLTQPPLVVDLTNEEEMDDNANNAKVNDNSAPSLDSLPSDVLHRVLMFCDARTLWRVERTSRRLREEVGGRRAGRVWRQVARNTLPDGFDALAHPHTRTWRRVFLAWLVTGVHLSPFVCLPVPGSLGQRHIVLVRSLSHPVCQCALDGPSSPPPPSSSPPLPSPPFPCDPDTPPLLSLPRPPPPCASPCPPPPSPPSPPPLPQPALSSLPPQSVVVVRVGGGRPAHPAGQQCDLCRPARHTPRRPAPSPDLAASWRVMGVVAWDERVVRQWLGEWDWSVGGWLLHAHFPSCVHLVPLRVERVPCVQATTRQQVLDELRVRGTKAVQLGASTAALRAALARATRRAGAEFRVWADDAHARFARLFIAALSAQAPRRGVQRAPGC